MNPQVMWDELLCAYVQGDWDLIETRASNLIDWLDRGGIPPKVSNGVDLGPDWDRALARAGCLFALETVQGQWSIQA